MVRELDTDPLPARVEIHEGIVVYPGDMLLITYEGQMSKEDGERLYDKVNARLPRGATLVVIGNGFRARP